MYMLIFLLIKTAHINESDLPLTADSPILMDNKLKNIDGSNDDLETLNNEYKTVMTEYIKENSNGDILFLYDINGDGFPELLNLSYEEGYFIRIYDFSGSEPKYIGNISCEEGEDIYLCQDSKENRFIIAHYGSYNSMGVISYNCEKANVIGHSISNVMLGKGITYFNPLEENGYKYYNGLLFFDGELKENIGYFNENNNKRLDSEKRLIQYMNEYLNNYEILDVITLPEYGEEEEFVARMQAKAESYNYIPYYNYEEWLAEYQKVVEDRKIMICGKEYDLEAQRICLKWDTLDETFDSDILNEFPNLQEIIFEGSYNMKADKRIPIKSSDWSKKIVVMRISPEYFELMGDMNVYLELGKVTLEGNCDFFGDISYLLDCPNIKVIECWVENGTLELVKLLSEIQSVEVITHSWHYDFYGEMTDAQREQVEEILSDKIFVGVK